MFRLCCYSVNYVQIVTERFAFDLFSGLPWENVASLLVTINRCITDKVHWTTVLSSFERLIYCGLHLRVLCS